MARRLRPLPRTEYTAGPWQGVRDTADTTSFDPKRLLVGTNILFQQEEIGTFVKVRPGYGRDVTAVGRTYGRAAYQFNRLNGDSYTLVFMDGKMYTLAIGALTEVVLSGVSLATPNPMTPETYPVYCTTFADLLVVSDGVNKPWTWDGSAFSEITAASGPWHGRPFVYYGKLGGILANDRTTFEWSDEGNPYAGYAGVTPSQSWQLRQTSSESLNAMLGTNDGLYYWRDSSFDVIRGAVSSDFSTSGTVSGISSTVGSKSPDAVEIVGDAIFFPDQYGRPHRYVIGGGLEQIWVDAQTATHTVNQDALPKACARYWPRAGAVLFALPGSFTQNMILVFDSDSAAYQGNWVTGPLSNNTPEYPGVFTDAHALGVVHYVDDTPPRLIAVSDQPWVFQNPDETGHDALPYHTDRWVVGPNTSTAIEVRIEPAHFGVDSVAPKVFSMVSGFHQPNVTGSITIDYVTSATSTRSTPLSVSISQAQSEAGTAEVRRDVGVYAPGVRFIRPRWTHNSYLTASTGYLFTLGRVRVVASIMPDRPYTR